MAIASKITSQKMRAHSDKGVTILELMVVLVIIGVMVAMVAPGISSAMADGRAADAAVDVVRLANAARSETNATGLAHVIVYDPFDPPGEAIAGGNPVGRMLLYRDETNNLTTCNPDRWNFAGLTAIDGVDLSVYNIGNSSHWITLEPVNTDNTVVTGNNVIDQICFQPDGRMMIRNSSDTSFGDTVNSVNHPLFAVFRKLNGALSGVPRQVVFTFGGSARIRR